MLYLVFRQRIENIYQSVSLMIRELLFLILLLPFMMLLFGYLDY